MYGFLIARAWPTRVQGLALVMALAGGALLMGRSYELSPDNVAGDLLCLVAGALYAAYFIIMARVGATIAPLPALALSSLVSKAFTPRAVERLAPRIRQIAEIGRAHV